MLRVFLGLAVVPLVFLTSVTGSDASRTPGRLALTPNAIAFRDSSHGLAGTGWISCGYPQATCRPAGTISRTFDGGRTWRVVLRTPRPVAWVGVVEGISWARFDDGENLRSTDGGRTWRPAIQLAPPYSPCPQALAQLSDVFVTAGGREWALCAGQGGAGSMGKAVYRLTPRGWRRVAWTQFGPPGRGYGGISIYGYPLGIAMADDGFGLIWESRGTLYVTRDGARLWQGLPKIARPEVDFGVFGAALPDGVGFVLLMRGDARRLLETHDYGRTWHVVHRWR